MEGPVQAEAQREKGRAAVKEGKASSCGWSGRAGKAGQVTWVRWQGPGQITQNLLGSRSGLDLF